MRFGLQTAASRARDWARARATGAPPSRVSWGGAAPVAATHVLAPTSTQTERRRHGSGAGARPG